MPLTYPALKVELNTDPLTYGYAEKIATGDDVGLADLINRVRNGTDGEAAITVRRADILISDIYAAIDVVDYTALPANPTATQLSTERRFLSWMGGIGPLGSIRLLNDDGTDTPVIKNFRAMFGAGTGTMTRLNALANRNGSRAEQLFGAGVRVTPEDIAVALRQT